METRNAKSKLCLVLLRCFSPLWLVLPFTLNYSRTEIQTPSTNRNPTKSGIISAQKGSNSLWFNYMLHKLMRVESELSQPKRELQREVVQSVLRARVEKSGRLKLRNVDWKFQQIDLLPGRWRCAHSAFSILRFFSLLRNDMAAPTQAQLGLFVTGESPLTISAFIHQFSRRGFGVLVR